jgi:hypothetical protein
LVRRRPLLAALALALAAPAARAHGSRVGDIVVDHPYAVPMPAGARNGAAYLRSLSNRGRQPDRLLGASTPRARRVELQRSTRDGDVLRMRAIDAIELPPGAELRLRHGGELHLMLVDVNPPLRDGQRFALRLRFERAGEIALNVWVQTPREALPHSR